MTSSWRRLQSWVLLRRLRIGVSFCVAAGPIGCLLVILTGAAQIALAAVCATTVLIAGVISDLAERL